jgi:hypothetical protein
MCRSVLVALAIVLTASACGGSGGGPSNSGGDNLLENPGAEQNVDGYIGHNGATVSQDTTTASEGAASVNVSIPDASGAGVQVWKTDGTTMTPVTAGQRYQFSLDVKGDLGKSVRMEVLWHSGEGGFLETSLGPILFLPLGSFSRTEFSATAPENAGLAVPQLVTDAAPGQTVTVWLDSVRFVQTSGSSSPTATASPAANTSPASTAPPTP